MNVFIVGLPMKIALGLLALLLIMPGFSNTLDYLFERMFAYISIIIQSMAKG
jgi:flagellar biosynthesis protein FliR